jgi:WD40 repeat protein
VFEKIGEIQEHSGAVYAISYDHSFIYSASADGYVARWSIETLAQDNFAIKCTTPPYSITFDTNSRNLWFGLSSGDLHVVHVDSKTEIKFFQQHKASLFSLHFLPNKNLVLAGDAEGNLSVWDAEKLTLLLFLPLNCGKIRKINASSDEKLISINGMDEKIRIFETDGFNEIITLSGHENGSNCSFFSTLKNDDSVLISGGKDGHIKKWDWQNEKLIESIPAHNFAIYDFIMLNDNKNFVSASRDKTIKIWNLSDLSFIQKIDLKSGGHKHSVNSLVKIDDYRFLSCSDDRKIILWSRIAGK